jgi:hypothetical protein
MSGYEPEGLALSLETVTASGKTGGRGGLAIALGREPALKEKPRYSVLAGLSLDSHQTLQAFHENMSQSLRTSSNYRPLCFKYHGRNRSRDAHQSTAAMASI